MKGHMFDRVFICCYSAYQVWSLTEGSCLMTLTGHHDAVTCLNLTFDSRKVISGSLDHNLKFWDLLNGKVSTCHLHLHLAILSNSEGEQS